MKALIVNGKDGREAREKMKESILSEYDKGNFVVYFEVTSSGPLSNHRYFLSETKARQNALNDDVNDYFFLYRNIVTDEGHLIQSLGRIPCKKDLVNRWNSYN